MPIEQNGGATGWPQSPGSVFQAHLHVTHFSFWEKESKKLKKIIDFFHLFQNTVIKHDVLISTTCNLNN